MNTDNFSLHGETIDYGPFDFIEWYDEDFCHNADDDDGRYAFGKQPTWARGTRGSSPIPFPRYSLLPQFEDQVAATVDVVNVESTKAVAQRTFDTICEAYWELIVLSIVGGCASN